MDFKLCASETGEMTSVCGITFPFIFLSNMRSLFPRSFSFVFFFSSRSSSLVCNEMPLGVDRHGDALETKPGHGERPLQAAGSSFAHGCVLWPHARQAALQSS